jgi:hypothetical protein
MKTRKLRRNKKSKKQKGGQVKTTTVSINSPAPRPAPKPAPRATITDVRIDDSYAYTNNFYPYRIYWNSQNAIGVPTVTIYESANPRIFPDKSMTFTNGSLTYINSTLKPSTNYFYSISVNNRSGGPTVFSNNFTTRAAPPSSAPRLTPIPAPRPASSSAPIPAPIPAPIFAIAVLATACNKIVNVNIKLNLFG